MSKIITIKNEDLHALFNTIKAKNKFRNADETLEYLIKIEQEQQEKI